MVLRLGDEDHFGSGAHPCNRVLLSAFDTGAVRARDLQLPSRNKSRCQWLEYLRMSVAESWYCPRGMACRLCDPTTRLVLLVIVVGGEDVCECCRLLVWYSSLLTYISEHFWQRFHGDRGTLANNQKHKIQEFGSKRRISEQRGTTVKVCKLTLDQLVLVRIQVLSYPKILRHRKL